MSRFFVEKATPHIICLTDISIYDTYVIMIKEFADKVTADIYHGTNSKYARKIPRELHSKARRLLDQLNASPTLGFLRIPPGNRLEKMSGGFEEFWSVRINDQWRIVFKWIDNDAFEVKITDYH